MTQCRECGANLPDEARTCMQCGTPVELSAKSGGRSQPNLVFVQPAIVGGLLAGLLSSIPILELGIGVWILGGGAFTVYLLLKQHPTGIGYGDGAFGGVLSGFVGAVVATLMLIPSKLKFPSDFEQIHREIEKQWSKNPNAHGPLFDLFMRSLSQEVSLTTELFTLFVYGFIYSLIAMLGGLLMVWLTNRRLARQKRSLP